MPPPRTTIFFMGLSDFKRYQGNGRQQQRHDPETGDDLGFEETLFLVVMVVMVDFSSRIMSVLSDGVLVAGVWLLLSRC